MQYNQGQCYSTYALSKHSRLEKKKRDIKNVNEQLEKNNVKITKQNPPFNFF